MEARYKRGWIRWMDTFNICKAQIEQYGAKPLPADLKGANGILLSAWVANNRSRYRNGKLTEEQRSLLDSIHIFNVRFRSERRHKMSATERKWIACCEFCREMLEQYGDEPLPADLRTPDNVLLMQWVTLNRQYYRQGILPQERREMIEAAGILDIRFAEKAPKPKQRLLVKPDENWLADLEICKKAFEAAGDAPVAPDIICSDGRSILKWCERNRIRYQRGYLSQECCEMLDAIGLFETLCTEADAKWYENYLLCKAFVERSETHTIPADMQTVEGKSLRFWLNRVRNGRLSAVQRRLLESANLIYVQPKNAEIVQKTSRQKWTYINMTDAEHELLRQTATRYGYGSVEGFIRARIAERMRQHGQA